MTWPARSLTPRSAIQSSGIVEVAGPEQFGLDDLIRKGLSSRAIRGRSSPIRSPAIRRPLDKRMLIPGDDALTFKTRFEDWIAHPGT